MIWANDDWVNEPRAKTTNVSAFAVTFFVCPAMFEAFHAIAA